MGTEAMVGWAALKRGERRPAARQFAIAVAGAPDSDDARLGLEEACRLEDMRGLFPLGDRQSVPDLIGRAYAEAYAGDPGLAVVAMIKVAAADPGGAWTEAPWWGPDAIRRVTPSAVTEEVRRLALALPAPVPADRRAAYLPYLELARVLAETFPGEGELLAAASAIARRFPDAAAEAVTWCERARRTTRGVPSDYIDLLYGYALRAAERPADAVEVWSEVAERRPEFVEVRVDIAETLIGELGDVDRGLTVLDLALAVAPRHPKAYPSALGNRYRRDHDPADLLRLVDFLREDPEHHTYAATMLVHAAEGRMWLRHVPSLTDTLTGLAERPSPAEPAAARLLREVAAVVWSDPWAAYQGAGTLGELSLDELLGLIDRVPAPPEKWRRMPDYWVRHARTWICLALLHHRPDEEWATSTRRKVLLDLVRDADAKIPDGALFALIVAAWADPAIRAEVAALAAARLKTESRTARPRAQSGVAREKGESRAGEAALLESFAALTGLLPAHRPRGWFERFRRGAASAG